MEISVRDHPVLEIRNITKRFGGIVALSKVSLQLYPQEILALLGDNGAGKSTLVKIICGAYQPNEGEIFLQGKKIKVEGPKKARELGIEVIYQDMALFDILDVPANLFAGKEIVKIPGILNRKEMKSQTKRILERLNLSIKSINQLVRNLSGGQRHAVSISRAIYVGNTPKIVLMDEPTAGLGVEESNRVLTLIKDLKKKQTSIILISHNLDHVFAVADRAVILRSGKLVGEKKIEETTPAELVQMMLGG